MGLRGEWGTVEPSVRDDRRVSTEKVDHPAHYGGADNPHEPIKVIEHYGLGFCLGNAVKYILRAPHKGALLDDLRKARWYLDRHIGFLERQPGGE